MARKTWDNIRCQSVVRVGTSTYLLEVWREPFTEKWFWQVSGIRKIRETATSKTFQRWGVKEGKDAWDEKSAKLKARRAAQFDGNLEDWIPARAESEFTVNFD